MLWPTADPFPKSDQPYPQGYYGWQPSVLDFQEGVLHDGYQPSKPGVASGSGVANATLGPAWVRRQQFRSDVQVTLTAYKAAASGSGSDQTLLRHGVIARASGGSSAGSKPLVRYVGGSCYFMERESLGSGNYRFHLWRYNAGVATSMTATASAQYVPGTHRNPHSIRLRVTTLGDGTVQLRGYWKTYFDSQFSQVFNVIDSTTGKLTGIGRCGFALDHEYQSGANQTISVATEFSVTDSDSFLTDSAGALAWEDDFTRSDRGIGQAWTDKWGTLGRNVLADYSADGAGFAGYLMRQGNLAAGGVSFATLAAYRSHAARLDGAGDYLELESPSVALRDPGGGNHRFTVAVWARLDENRSGNELYAFVDQTPAKPQKLMYWGLRTEPQIGGQEAASFEIRVRSAVGSDTLVSYTSSPFVVEPYLTHTYCWVLTYKEKADPIQGDSRIRLYVGRSSRATLLAELTIAPAHAFKLSLSNSDHYIGRRFAFTGSNSDTYLKGDIARVVLYYKYLVDADVDRVCDAYQDEKRFALGDITDPTGYDNAWNFETFQSAFSRNYYESEEVPGTTGAWKDLDASTRVTGVLPLMPPERLDAFWARPYHPAEGQSRTVEVTLGGPFDRAAMSFRCRITGDDGVYDGYRIEVGEGSPAAVTIYRVIGGVYTVLGRQPASTGTRNVTVDTPFDFACEVYNLYPDRTNGPAAIRVLIDGVAVPLKSLDPKVSVTISGHLVDHSVEHLWGDVIVFGLGGAPLNTDVDFDTYNALAPEESGVDVDGILGLPFPAESDGAVGSLNDVVKVDQEISRSVVSAQSRMPTADGGQKVALLDGGERETYALRSVQMTDAERADFEAFLRSHGSSVPFNADPGKWIRGLAPGVFRFGKRSYSVEQVQGGHVVSFTIVRMR